MPNVASTFPLFFLEQGKNRQGIINGNFDVWQRGESFIDIDKGFYCADRWIIDEVSSVRNPNVSRHICTDEERDLTGSANAIFIETPYESVYTLKNALCQRIPDVKFYGGRPVSVSLWMWSDKIRGVSSIEIRQHFGTGGTPSADVTTVVTADLEMREGVIECRSYTTQLPSTEGKTLGTNGDDYTELRFILSAYHAERYYITGIQFNVGTQALPTIHEPPDKVLAECHRFYERVYAHTSFFPIYGIALADDEVACVLSYSPKWRDGVLIRCDDSPNYFVDGYGGQFAVTGFSQLLRPENRNTSNISFMVDAGSLTPHQMYCIHSGFGLHYIEIDAEL